MDYAPQPHNSGEDLGTILFWESGWNISMQGVGIIFNNC